MRTFYFNEILPSHTEKDIVTVFEEAIARTATLVKKIHLDTPIITGKPSHDISICGMSLATIIDGLKNKDVKTEAWFMFTHNIIRQHEGSLTDEDYDELLCADYQFEGQSAINLAISHKLDCPLFSLPLSEALQKDFLKLTSAEADSIDVANYYAQNDTSFIEQWFIDKATTGLVGLDRLVKLLCPERVILADEFKKEWDAVRQLYQVIIHDRFNYVLENNMLFPVRADDVTIQKDELKAPPDVYELRQKGQGIRVYFGYTDDGSKIILAGISTKSKSEGREQSTDIEKAQRRIKKVLATLGN